MAEADICLYDHVIFHFVFQKTFETGPQKSLKKHKLEFSFHFFQLYVIQHGNINGFSLKNPFFLLSISCEVISLACAAFITCVSSFPIYSKPKI